MKDGRPLRLGTRGSRLALAQAAIVVGLISRVAPEVRIEVVPIKTEGDVGRQHESPGKDLKLAFTHEIDRQLLDGKVDIAVHSLKDVPTVADARLVIGATPPRGDPRDVLVTASGQTMKGLQSGAAIGTSSIRRRVQLSRIRRDIRVVGVRGNLETRIDRMREKGLDGVVLAAAGLQRLGRGGEASQYFQVDEMVPAACQGILGVEAPEEDADVLGILKMIDDPPTRLQSVCERAFLSKLGGDCNFPAGAYAQVAGSEMTVIGMVASPDGSSETLRSISGPASAAGGLGARLAEELLRSKVEAS